MFMSMTDSISNRSPRISIALLSASSLAYEILLMRLFSVIQWHHFAYMMISLALLGYGASGAFLAIFSRRLSANYEKVFIVNILLFAISTLVLFLLAQQIPFNAQEVLWDARQPWYLLALYLVLAVPFFFAATSIGLALMHCRADISRLYAADMLGAGVGSVGIVLLLFATFPENSLRIISALGITTAIIACWELRVAKTLKWMLLPVVALPLLLPATWVHLKISPYKGLSQALQITGSEVVAEYSSPLGLLSIVKNPVIPFRHAPGLSLNSTNEPPAQLGVFTDADAMTVITEYAGDYVDRERFAYLDELTSAVPYHLSKPLKVLVLGAGGGSGILQARFHAVKHIDAVELNPQIVNLLRRDYAQFSGDLYNDDNIHVHISEARGFVSGAETRYDLIQVALLDSFNASSAGLYALNESYLYTVEALQEYLRHLTPNGYLVISRWIKLPARDTLKLFATAVAALKQNGIEHSDKHLALIRSWQTSTLLVKNGAFNPAEIKALKEFCTQRAFDVAYYPAMPVSEANRYNRMREPVYYQAAQALLSDQHDSFLKDYKFNIRPATDDKPYFFNFFKWSVLPEILTLMGRGGMPLLDLGYLVLIATLLQALFVSLVFIILPLYFIKRGAGFQSDAGIPRWRVFAYFLCLGLAFLFIEIAFIQKFILFLHHPLYAVAVVLASFFIFAGLGSAFTKRYSLVNKHSTGIRHAASGIVMFCLLYLILLGPVFSLLLEWPIMAKAIVAVFFIAPLAFCMGMPFPLGLSLLAERMQHLVPWAWGINGCASVLSAILATLLAIHFGFTVVIAVAMVLYGVAAFLLNQTTSKV